MLHSNSHQRREEPGGGSDDSVAEASKLLCSPGGRTPEQQPGTDWEREDSGLQPALDTVSITAVFPSGVVHQPAHCQPQHFLHWAECIFSQISVPSICSRLMLWQHGPSLVFWLLPWEIVAKAHHNLSFLHYSDPLFWRGPLLRGWVLWCARLEFEFDLLCYLIYVILEKLPSFLSASTNISSG